MQADHNRFWEQAAIVILLERLQIVFDLASNDIFAARVFNAHSATARLRAIKAVLMWKGTPAPTLIIEGASE